MFLQAIFTGWELLIPNVRKMSKPNLFSPLVSCPFFGV